MRWHRHLSALVFLLVFAVLGSGQTPKGKTPKGGDKGKTTKGADKGKAKGADKDRPTVFLPLVHQFFNTWDRDRNGELSADEIERLVPDPTVRGELAVAVIVLRKNLGTAKNPHPPLTLENLTKAALTPRSGKEQRSDLDVQFLDVRKQIMNADRRLFGPFGPRLECIHQGALADCFCIAPLGAFVHRNPAAVVKMFEWKSGKIHVTFGGGRTIDILPLTDAEYALAGGSTENNGAWVRVYEKALGAYLSRKKDPEQAGIATRAISGGGVTSSVMTILTGHDIESVRLGKIRNTNTSDDKRRELLDNVRKKMSAATQARRLMCGAVGTLEKKIPGIVPGHAYGILGYDTKTDLVMVWNPWGNNRKAKGSPGLEYGYFMQDGKFLVPLTELVQFMHIEIETDRPRLGK